MVGRITGLDPAGPRFFDGPFNAAIPELADNVLSKESANFVDVIHTNGGFDPCIVCTDCKLVETLKSSLCISLVHCGTILQLGHLDFYPSGGSVQPGCLFGIDARPGGCIDCIEDKYFILCLERVV